MATEDAIGILESDHKSLKTKLEALAETSSRAVKRRKQLYEAIRTELEAHTTIEEQIFYPAFRKHLSTSDAEKMYFEALEEHHAARVVLADLGKADPATPSFGGKAKVLKELVLHHAEEEEDEMFPKARKALGKDLLLELGERMRQRKQALLKAA
jgi:iron-sulfur cluster repair protein YtfE (RIC family)